MSQMIVLASTIKVLSLAVLDMTRATVCLHRCVPATPFAPNHPTPAPITKGMRDLILRIVCKILIRLGPKRMHPRATAAVSAWPGALLPFLAQAT